MRRGLVIGKFMPVHSGHIALVEFAVKHCDEVIVSMSYTPNDPIDPELRFAWLSSIFAGHPKIKTEYSLDDFDDPGLALNDRTRIWAAFIQKRFPAIDVIFSSEEYGELLAGHLEIPHVMFDSSRSEVPVSASMIRDRPLSYWDYIPEIVRPYFVKKICFYGPESTGKSTLARYFAELYRTEFVPEVARELILSNDFSLDDIVAIGQGQTDRVLEKAKVANKFLFCDTDLITTEIYCQYYLHEIPAVLLELEARITYVVYFLMDIDVPWVADGLRDLGEKRKEMYDVFKNELDKRGLPYVVVSGPWEERVMTVEKTLRNVFTFPAPRF